MQRLAGVLASVGVVTAGTGLQAEEPRPPASASAQVFLYSFFREPNGASGLCLAYSEDLFHWNEIQGPLFLSSIGDGSGQGEEEHRVFRDAFVAPDPEGGFHMVWTTGWGRRDIGYAHSPDLVHWEGERLIPVMEHRETAENCWAPKLFYDPGEKVWTILWSTTLGDDTFPRSSVPGTTRNHRIWSARTRDFQTFTEAEPFFDPGYSCIDAYLLQDGNACYLFFKDERANGDGAPFDARYQNIRMARGDGPGGPFRDVSPPITGQGPGRWENEGPSALRVGGFVYVFYDHHGVDGPYFGAVRSRDLEEWTDVSALFRFPPASKHGHVFKVSRDRVRGLIERGTPPPGP